MYTREAQRPVKFVCLSTGRRCCTDNKSGTRHTQKNSKWKEGNRWSECEDSSTAHQLYVFSVERDMLMAGNPGRSTRVRLARSKVFRSTQKRWPLYRTRCQSNQISCSNASHQCDAWAAGLSPLAAATAPSFQPSTFLLLMQI